MFTVINGWLLSYVNMSTSHPIVMGEDFSAADPLEIVFGLNETVACATVSIIDDTALEGDHSFSVILASTIPPITIDNTPVEVTIMDNEGTYMYLYKGWYCM